MKIETHEDVDAACVDREAWHQRATLLYIFTMRILYRPVMNLTWSEDGEMLFTVQGKANEAEIWASDPTCLMAGKDLLWDVVINVGGDVIEREIDNRGLIHLAKWLDGREKYAFAMRS